MCLCGRHYYHWAMQAWIVVDDFGQRVVAASAVPMACRRACGPQVYGAVL